MLENDNDDVIEIPPPASWKSKPPKNHNLIVSPEIIDVDDDDLDDVVIIDEKVSSKSKGKKPMLPNFSGHEVIILDDAPPQNDIGSSQQNSILKKLQLFKKFDTLEDLSDHFYDSTNHLLKESKSWANKIAKEWKLLEEHLPDTIYVRASESRMDLLRAVMVGANGTPYHDGLFFFDVQFPASYPNNPPVVTYHAHGLRINPNLYNTGYVCLSLLGTWSGSGNEKWRPLKSNMLQVLVSIQGLVLNAEPYYNEPAYVRSKNNKASEAYSEKAFLLSLQTVLYTMKNPPKNFEDLVFGHFYSRSHDILAACNAYLDGVKVGSYGKGKTKPAKRSKKTCSNLLHKDLPGYMKSLVEAFTKIGVTDCRKYLTNKTPMNSS